MLPRRTPRRDRKPTPGPPPLHRNEAGAVLARRDNLIVAEQPRPEGGPEPSTLVVARPASAHVRRLRPHGYAIFTRPRGPGTVGGVWHNGCFRSACESGRRSNH